MAEATCSLKELIRRILSGLSIDRAQTAKEQKKKLLSFGLNVCVDCSESAHAVVSHGTWSWTKGIPLFALTKGTVVSASIAA